MTLLELESGRKILIDVNICGGADDPDDETPDVAQMLRDRLVPDTEGRLYVDAFLLSHPDQDHCRGLKKHFHLGPPADWSKSADKIFIRELWSSPMVFRRASSEHVLCDDAAAFNCEARRRVKRFRDNGGLVSDGDRILILGEDEDGKTDDLEAILVGVEGEFSRVNGQYDSSMSARLLAPQPKSDDEDEEIARSKNHSSTIVNFSLKGEGVSGVCRFLTGGDAEVAIWERLWERYSEVPDWLTYDILQAPHHCSWHSLSYDSWSDKGEDAEVCAAARNALSQTRKGAVIVASSKAIEDDDNDPPCIRAEREYKEIAKAAGGSFECVGEKSELLEFEVGAFGPRRKTRTMAPAIIVSSGTVGRHPLPHG
jgi:hypothetical protein